jgi:L-threonylcarbamoyladenylate synthase
MTEAKILKITDASTFDLLKGPVEALKAGEAVGMPTETVYGLAANCLDSSASESIFRIKNRPMDNPLICHISSLEMLKVLVDPKWEMTAEVERVMNKFWPGPLTILLPAHPDLPKCVTAGLKTVGVRFPLHPVAQEMIKRAGVPLAAPSANLSGRPSPTTAAHVFADLHDRINWIVDGGSCGVGLESTVVDLLSTKPPMILRPGGITQAMLMEIVPDIQVYQQKKFRSTDAEKNMIELDESRPPTPGMKYKHYAPNAPVWLYSLKSLQRSVTENSAIMTPKILEHLRSCHKLSSAKKIIRLRVCESLASDLPEITRNIFLSRTGCLAEIAQNLFSALREADEESPDLIIAEAVEEEDEGLAIMNRLVKSAGEEIIYLSD